MSAGVLPPAALARLRGATYRLLGGAFLYPDEQRLPALVALARRLQDERRRAAVLAFYGLWSRCIDALATADAEAEVLPVAFVRTFLIEPAFGACIPQESAFLAGPDGTGSVVGALEREYATAGLVLAGTGEPSDHVAVELGFMAHLCEEETAAWGRDRCEAGPLLDRESRFLRAHLGRWLPAFAERVAGAPQPGIYRQVVETASAFVHHDTDLVEVLASAVAAVP